MNENKTLIRDMTQGHIMRQLIVFSLPLILANTLQVLYNLVDMFFVGRFGGTNALSAVSIGGQITTFMFFCFMGIGTAGQICVAQAVGSGDRKRMGGLIGNAVLLSALTSLILMIAIPLARPILRLIQTPEEIMTESVQYLVICTAGNIVVAMYNTLNGVLRGMGDSAHPTMFVLIGTVVNIVLDYVFVVLWHMGAAGAAIATVIGQSAACVFAVQFLVMNRDRLGFALTVRSFLPQKEHVRLILKIGVPISLKNMLVCASSLFVSAWINSFGVVAVAVTGLCQKLQNLINIIAQAMMDAVATMVGQNITAGRADRVKRVVWDAALFGIIFAAVLSAIFLLFPRQVFGLFSTDAEVIAMAPKFMVVTAMSLFFGVLMTPTMGMINGVGDTMYNLIVGMGDGLAGRMILSVVFGFAMNMGALGFYLGSSLAAIVSVAGGAIYFFAGMWKKKLPQRETAQH